MYFTAIQQHYQKKVDQYNLLLTSSNLAKEITGKNNRNENPFFGQQDEPLPLNTPKFPDKFPDVAWVGKIRQYVDGSRTAKFIPSAQATMAIASTKAIKNIMKLTGTGIPQHSLLVRSKLESFFNQNNVAQYTGNRTQGEVSHPDEGNIMQSIIILEALICGGKLTLPHQAKVISLAIAELSVENRRALMKADELTGRRLYSILYTRSKGHNELSASFATIKKEAQMARITTKLDSHDRSGKSSQLVTDMVAHLQTNGIPEEEQQKFVDKFLFKLTINNGTTPDIPVIDTQKKGWRENLNARLLSTFAEIPSTSDESIRKSLDLPLKDLSKMIGHAFIGPLTKHLPVHPGYGQREGDARIIRIIREVVKDKANLPGFKDLDNMLELLETNAYDRELFLRETQKGTPLHKILAKLEEVKRNNAKEITLGVNGYLSAISTGLRERLEKIEQELAKENLPEKERRLLTIEKKEYETFKTDPPFTEKDINKLSDLFGPFPMRGIASKTSFKYSSFLLTKGTLAKFRQMRVHIATLNDPSTLIQSLDNMVLVLPTAGKELATFPWVYSTAKDLVRLATLIKTTTPNFTLNDYPMIIIDQTDGKGDNEKRMAVWNKNKNFIKSLEEKHEDLGLTIKHIGMRSINNMITGSGIEKLFDTTGETNAGYGGARNLGFFMGPVLYKEFKRNGNLDGIKPETVKRLIKENSLENAPKLFLGDDTDQVNPNMLFSKASLQTDPYYKDSYNLIGTSRGGRDTQGVTPANIGIAIRKLQDKGLDGFKSALFHGNIWSNKATKPGMGCTFSSPRFCLDLPTGAEEKNHEAMQMESDLFTNAMHLSSDRQAKTSNYLKGNIAYTNMTEVVANLIPGMGMPWNTETEKQKHEGNPISSNLKDVLKIAADPVKNVQFRKKTLEKLVDLRNDKRAGVFRMDGAQEETIKNYLAANPKLDDETKDELIEIKNVFKKAKEEAQLVKKFVDLFFKKVAPNANSAPQIKSALTTAVGDGSATTIKDALLEAKNEMETEGISFGGDNRMLRDYFLVLQSTIAGGFSQLTNKFFEE